jgi:hypothetical protein
MVDFEYKRFRYALTNSIIDYIQIISQLYFLAKVAIKSNNRLRGLETVTFFQTTEGLAVSLPVAKPP